MNTILYIHGFNSSGTVFNHILSKLPKHTAVVVEYDSRQSVNDALVAIKQKIPTGKYFIIAHSLGGVLAHRIACEDSNVQGLVTISTPFGGHDIAGILHWFYPRLQVLKDLSPFSKTVKASKTKKPECRWLNIVTTGGSLPFMLHDNDGVVAVKSQHASNADHTVIVDTNHFEIVQHPKLLREIRRLL